MGKGLRQIKEVRIMSERLGVKQAKDSSVLTDNPSLIKVLLIEDNPGDSQLVREMLKGEDKVQFEVIHFDRLSPGLEYLSKREIDMVLLDLSLPDSQGLETFIKVHTQAPDVPIILLTGLDDKDLALKALHEGAQDYLVKGQIDSHLLVRVIR
jgi:DNA-binding response OmpR family regulator